MRMYFLIPLFVFTLFTQISFAQYTPLDRCVEDSLSHMMPNESMVERAEIYLRLAKMWESVPQKSYNYIMLAIPISIHENNMNLKAQTRMALGDYCNAKRRFIEAMEHYQTALKQFQWVQNVNGEMMVLSLIGNLYGNLGEYNAALTYFNEGLKNAQMTKNRSMQGTFRNLIATMYQLMGNYQQSTLFFQQALLDFRIAAEKENEMNVQSNIGTLLLDQGRYKEVLAHYYWLINNGDTSKNYFMGTLYTRMAHSYSQMDDHLNSLKYNKRALAKREEIHNISGVSSSLINVAGDFLSLGLLDSGKFYIERGVRLALQNNWRHLVENGYRHLYQYYLTHGIYDETLTYYQLYTAENECISLEKSKSNIAILEARKHIQRIKESENLLLKEHKIRSLNISNQLFQFVFVEIITLLAGVSMVVFLGLFLLSRRVRRKMQEMNRLLSVEIMDRKATEHQTRERERQYRFLTENSVDMISQMDSQKKQVYISPSSNKMFGYTQQELMGKSAFFLTHPDFHPYAESIFNELQVTRTPRQLTYLAKKKNGAFFWVESIINPLFDLENGLFKGLVTVTRDIQERKIKEFEIMEGTKQKENLLKEIHHRVKNNFAILVSLINMQMAQSKNPELLQSLTNLQLRIRTMALVHEMLYRSKDFESISFLDYLRSLASVIAGTYNRHDIVLTFEVEETIVDIEAAIPLGLIVNEILSNAYTHAFPDNRAGRIRISLINDTINKKNTLILQDDGIGMPDDVKPEHFKTMGLQIVQILCKQIDGNLTLINNPGASFTITFQSFQN